MLTDEFIFRHSIATNKDPSPEIWNWYLALCAVSVFNIIVYIKILMTKENVKKEDYNYVYWMKVLAFPYVLQCAWRSFFPELYNQRITFWDTPLNSCFIGRGLATIGEVTWIAQCAMGLINATRKLP